MMRVAALLPAATEIVVALGAADRLVAVTHACTPPAGVPPIPRVTRSRIHAATPFETDQRVRALSGEGAPLFELDADALVASRPDVILTQGVCDVCAVREGDVVAVARTMAPAPVVVSLEAATVDGVFRDTLVVGGAIGLPDEAEELVTGWRSRVHAVHARLKAHRAPRPRVAVIEWTDPLFCAGHWVPDMVRRAGGQEVLGTEGTMSRRVAVHEVSGAAPEVIVVAPCGIDVGEAHRQAAGLRASRDWRWSSALRWWAIDANRLTASPGPGVVHGIEVLARILHPGLFGAPASATARSLRGGPVV